MLEKKKSSSLSGVTYTEQYGIFLFDEKTVFFKIMFLITIARCNKSKLITNISKQKYCHKNQNILFIKSF